MAYLKMARNPTGEGARKRKVGVKDREADGTKLCSSQERLLDFSPMGRETTGDMWKTSRE